MLEQGRVDVRVQHLAFPALGAVTGAPGLQALEGAEGEAGVVAVAHGAPGNACGVQLHPARRDVGEGGHAAFQLLPTTPSSPWVAHADEALVSICVLGHVREVASIQGMAARRKSVKMRLRSVESRSLM